MRTIGGIIIAILLVVFFVWPGNAFGHPVWGPWGPPPVVVAGGVAQTATPKPAPTQLPATATVAAIPTTVTANPVPAATPTVATPAGGSNPTQPQPSNGIPYNVPPQPQIGHPSLYTETGVPCHAMVGGITCTNVSDHTKAYNFVVLPGTTAIVGGFTVDGTSGGVYKAVAGPTTLTATVTDGFALVTQNSWANAEFCFRVAQAAQYGWAHAHVSPLAGWKACGQ